MNDETWVQSYLERIRAPRVTRCDAASLSVLHQCHLLAVPFENLSVHLGEPILLDAPALLDKVVRRRRGGLCYELNGSFAMLLAALGYEVTLLSACVIGAEGPGPPFGHMAVRVDGAEPWLVDVGFGPNAPLRPLRLDDRSDQPDPDGIFRFVGRPDDDVDLLCDGEPQYRVELRARVISDFEPTCWWHQTSPQSPFTASPVCTLPTVGGRVTIADRTLIRTTRDAGRQEITISDDVELIAAYASHFGIVLDRVPDSPFQDR